MSVRTLRTRLVFVPRVCAIVARAQTKTASRFFCADVQRDEPALQVASGRRDATEERTHQVPRGACVCVCVTRELEQAQNANVNTNANATFCGLTPSDVMNLISGRNCIAF